MGSIKIENGFKYVNFLEYENIHSLLELTSQANLSEREIDELPFDMNTTYSSFFDIDAGESEEGIYLCVHEVGGCFCEEMYTLKLKEFPSEEICSKIKEIIFNLKIRNSTVYNFVNELQNIKDLLNVESVILNNFEKDSKKQDAISKLRNNIEDSIDLAIITFRKNSDLPKEILDEVCRTVRKEYRWKTY